MPITFYSAKEMPYGCFSNFSGHGFHFNGKWWPTSEHYFQAQKFIRTPLEEKIRRAKSPMVAARIGRICKLLMRRDWETVKDDMMRRAVRAKFGQNADIRAILLGTGDEELIKNAPDDAYWGCGKDSTGKNMLGVILMEVREALQVQEQAKKNRPPATRDSWKSEPLPKARVCLPFERTFSLEEYEHLRRGFVPQEMEDKWFIFLEDDLLYFHRSWTGYCVYQLRLEAVEGSYKIAEAWASRNPEQYTATDDEVDVFTLKMLIDNLLLK